MRSLYFHLIFLTQGRLLPQETLLFTIQHFRRPVRNIFHINNHNRTLRPHTCHCPFSSRPIRRPLIKSKLSATNKLPTFTILQQHHHKITITIRPFHSKSFSNQNSNTIQIMRCHSSISVSGLMGSHRSIYKCSRARHPKSKKRNRKKRRRR